MTTTQHRFLLEELAKKTVSWQGEPHIASQSVFNKFVISKKDFKTVLDIIRDEPLLVLPKENTGGSIEGYDLLDVRGNLLLRFGEPNLSECGYKMPKLFQDLVQSEDNKVMYEMMVEEKIQLPALREKFESCPA